MANPLKGEIDLTVGDETFKLALDINQLIEVEEEVGLDLTAILQGLRTVSLKVDRAILWAALQAHHAPCNLLRSGEIFAGMIADRGLKDAHAAILNLVAAVMPDDKKGGDKPRPRRAASAKAGTGNAS